MIQSVMEFRLDNRKKGGLICYVMSGAGQATPNPEKSGYLRLGGKPKPLDCRNSLSSKSEQGQEML